MSDSPRHTPQPHDLFMALWHQRMFQEGSVRPGGSGWGPKEILHWAKVWIDCAELAGRLEEMEAKAAEAQTQDPERWPPVG